MSSYYQDHNYMVCQLQVRVSRNNIKLGWHIGLSMISLWDGPIYWHFCKYCILQGYLYPITVADLYQISTGIKNIRCWISARIQHSLIPVRYDVIIYDWEDLAEISSHINFIFQNFAMDQMWHFSIFRRKMPHFSLKPCTLLLHLFHQILHTRSLIVGFKQRRKWLIIYRYERTCV